MALVKIIVSVKPNVYRTLDQQAGKRNVTVQELIRAVVLPEWIAHAKPVEGEK